MEPNHLLSLPAELICLVMDSIPSWRDFYSFVRSSSLLYSAFTQQKERLLSNLLRRVLLSRDLERDARIALRSLDYPFTSQRDSTWRGDQPTVDVATFFEDTQVANFSDRRIALPLSTGLWKLHRANEYFLEDYCRRALSYIHQASAPAQPPDPKFSGSPLDSLSRTELLRLHRAFYRYNTCQSIYAARGGRLSLYARPQTYLNDFLKDLEHWEVEEIACVHGFILHRLSDVIGKWEEELIQRLVDADALVGDTVGRGQQDLPVRLQKLLQCVEPSCELPLDFLGTSLSIFDWKSPYRFFSIESKTYHHKSIETWATRGTQFLNQFVNGDFATRLHLINSTSFATRSRVFVLYGYLNGECEARRRDRHVPEIPNDLHQEPPKIHNKAWVWAMNQSLEDGGDRNRQLRAAGYVFWDQDRLDFDPELLVAEPHLNPKNPLSLGAPAIVPCAHWPSVEDKMVGRVVTAVDRVLPDGRVYANSRSMGFLTLDPEFVAKRHVVNW